MTTKLSDLNKRLYGYQQAWKILKEDDYFSMFIIVDDKPFNVTAEDKLEVISLLTNAIVKLNNNI